jgi:Flavin reductase like domain
MAIGYFSSTRTASSILLLAITLSSGSGLQSHLRATETPPLLSVPTYSLATLNEDGSTNMNIVTYATPVSIAPTRVWSMGLLKDTLSDVNLRRTGRCVLQLLSDEHAPMVPLLGGMSGRVVDKSAECEKLGFKWRALRDDDLGDDGSDGGRRFEVLPGCVSYLKMQVQGGVVDAGSHIIVPFCQVTAMYTSGDGGDDGNKGNSKRHLSTGKLRELGLITEKGRVSEEAKCLLQDAPYL